MPRIKDCKFVTFNDGLLDICEAKNRIIIRTKQAGIRFGKQKIGITRFWKAKVESSTVDALVAIPPVPGIHRQDICIINRDQYKIIQVQEEYDQSPPCLVLTLEKCQVLYKDVR